MPVVVLLADGVRPDTLAAAMDAGALPALARLRDEGGLHTITSVFPSVTGPAYAPFLMGRFPAPVGLPGIRWFDRARTACRAPDYTRSYVGHQMPRVDTDVDAHAPTIFELVPSSAAALSVITRGLAPRNRLGGLDLRSAVRAARTHFSGDVRGWLTIDSEVADTVVRRLRDAHPDYAFAAFTGVDKASHARGHDAPLVVDALRIVDDAAARIRADAERDGRWRDLHLWVVSDHGHSPVRQHEDLQRRVEELGFRVMAHPWVFTLHPDVAVMVSGNAMAHLYVDLQHRAPKGWGALRSQWTPLLDALLRLPSVDLALLPLRGAGCEVRTRDRGRAIVARRGDRYRYEPVTGDPLGLGTSAFEADANEAHARASATDYPDSLVQVAHLAEAPRSGDIILSAARDWDLRARYEPIPHVSSHGALHREHMLVPLLVNRPPVSRPRRTVDVMPSALRALGL
ncbi:MAG TPA: alkaline phosphatase family protein, partial [Gemmatimonadaceae bacterium]|nr:alkaline phosphatase family protein [Gemmatimonadaceae bacterium]